MSVNKVILIGNLGRDPEQPRVLGQNNTRRVVTISIATSESYNDAKTGERKTDTEWHRVELWDNLADVAYKYLHKGSSVYVEGKIRTEKWTDQTGVERSGIKIRANVLTLLGSKNNSNATEGAPQPTNMDDSKTNTRTSDDDFAKANPDGLPF